MWSTFFQQKVLLAEYNRNIGVKGGGRTVLWSRYFHQILALIIVKIKLGTLSLQFLT